MITLIMTTFLIFFSFQKTENHWSSKLDPSDGITYFIEAEKLLASQVFENNESKIIIELFVLASVIDPSLRDSSIIGIQNVIQDQILISRLQNMRATHVLLNPKLIQPGNNTPVPNTTSNQNLCDILTKFRERRNLNENELNSLQPWFYLFPDPLRLMNRTDTRRPAALNKQEVLSSLIVELEILGGPSSWSAEYVTNPLPVEFETNDDLATMFNVDPSKKIRKGDKWVAE
tara:strand:+ start:36 stop:728 length:693 start_codon:yes stop_codon:yes gene_type:complete